MKYARKLRYFLSSFAIFFALSALIIPGIIYAMIFIPVPKKDYPDFVKDKQVGFVAACRRTKHRTEQFGTVFDYLFGGSWPDYFQYLPGEYTEEFWQIATQTLKINSSGIYFHPSQFHFNESNRITFDRSYYKNRRWHQAEGYNESEVFIWALTNIISRNIFQRRINEGVFKDINFSEYIVQPNNHGTLDKERHRFGLYLKVHYPSGYCDFMKHLILKGGDFDPDVLAGTRPAGIH